MFFTYDYFEVLFQNLEPKLEYSKNIILMMSDICTLL